MTSTRHKYQPIVVEIGLASFQCRLQRSFGKSSLSAAIASPAAICWRQCELFIVARGMLANHNGGRMPLGQSPALARSSRRPMAYLHCQ
ncbi:hypothetical protein Nepgr_007051 [Nepenthes gracilis]|uniref:Uncharacterized protein n=1 Tax=Nepenthes gracilis TaxID=150966 RepID=A0AAD3S6T5_NEPGR|nr:hypothetical protein Nepgr_007051 [Nepenthes gracilis]